MVAVGRQTLQVAVATDLYLAVIAARWGDEEESKRFSTVKRCLCAVQVGNSLFDERGLFLYVISVIKRIGISK